MLPHGFDLCLDIRKLDNRFQPRMIVDVGASFGQSAAHYIMAFPKAEIHCFEPVPETMSILRKRLGKEQRVHFHQEALGQEVGECEMHILSDLSMSTTQLDPRDAHMEKASVMVRMSNLNDMAQELNIAHIDLLKIDTEGTDLNVLKGASALLKERRIRFVQVEVGMNPTNYRHVDLQRVREFMEPMGYMLFSLYGQHLEWSGEQRLRFANAVFVAPELAGSVNAISSTETAVGRASQKVREASLTN